MQAAETASTVQESTAFNTVSHNAKSGFKYGAVIGLALGAVGLLATIFTGGAILPALGAMAYLGLNAGLTGGVIGCMVGGLKALFGRKHPPQDQYLDNPDGAPLPGVQSPELQPQISAPQQEVSASPSIPSQMPPRMMPKSAPPEPPAASLASPAAPQQGQGSQAGSVASTLVTALNNAQALQEKTAQLAEQLKATGIGVGEDSSGPEQQGQQNWQQQAQHAPSTGQAKAQR